MKSSHRQIFFGVRSQKLGIIIKLLNVGSQSLTDMKKKATKSQWFCGLGVIRLGLRNPAVSHWELTSYIFVYLGMPLFAHLDISMFFFVYGCKDSNNSPIFSD